MFAYTEIPLSPPIKKAPMTPERQRLVEVAVKAMKCQCPPGTFDPVPGSQQWVLSSEACPFHGSTQTRAIAVVNAIADALGVIP